jgi:hypothetical protein
VETAEQDSRLPEDPINFSELFPPILGSALDDHPEAVDRQAQDRVFHELRMLGLEPEAFIKGLHRPMVQVRLREQSLLRKRGYWTAVRHVYRPVLAAWEASKQALPRAGVLDEGRNRIDTRFRDLIIDLEAEAGGRTPEEVESELRNMVWFRSTLGPEAKRLGTNVAPKKFTTSTQQRLMPLLRGIFFDALKEPMRRTLEEERLRQYPKADREKVPEAVASSVASRTAKLTADVLRAFYPVWGRTSTPENVRKAVTSQARRGRSTRN